MEISDPDQTISLNITHFPQNLLIPSNENKIIIQAINRFNKQALFKFAFEGENLNIIIPDELKKDTIEFGSGESKTIEIKLEPIVDGFGKLSMFVNWMKIVEYTVKVKKVRNSVVDSQINKILKKQTLPVSKVTDAFNPDDFIIKMSKGEIKQLEKELQKQNNKSIEEIENILRKLIKGYLFNKDLETALKLSLELPDEKEKSTLHYDLIRAYASIDLDGSFERLKNIENNEKRLELIRNVASDQVKKDPEQAPRVAYLIEDPSIREKLIIDIISETINLNPSVAIKMSTLISDDLSKIKILFNIIKEFHKKNNREEILNILNNIVNIIEKSTNLNLSEHKYKNPAYNFYKDAICAIAEIDSPRAADNIIVGFNLREIKDRVAEDLFDVIYEMVDELRTKMEPSPVYSQYYLFNTLTSNINEFVKSFSLTGGNVSNNILLNEFNFNMIIVSLFNYDFSIFPIIDRVYSDLKFNLNKSFAYYIFPSKENYNQSELMTINNTLKQFFTSHLINIPNPLLIFNLDFIPYLGKPTIILSSNPEIYRELNSKISKTLGDSVNLIIDESLFKDGATTDNLKQLFPPNKCKIVNLILSYEFINDYNAFKSFIQSLI